jgi:hypothetical protein
VGAERPVEQPVQFLETLVAVRLGAQVGRDRRILRCRLARGAGDGLGQPRREAGIDHHPDEQLTGLGVAPFVALQRTAVACPVVPRQPANTIAAAGAAAMVTIVAIVWAFTW